VTALPAVKLERFPLLAAYQRGDRYDPTRTTALRNAFARDMAKRFRWLRGQVRRMIVDEDCFGLRPEGGGVRVVRIHRRDFDFPRSQDKIAHFMDWLGGQVDQGILQVSVRDRLGTSIEDAWTNVYIEDSYKRGVMRARYEMERAGHLVPRLEETGGITGAMMQPPHADRLGVLYTRTFTGLRGITQAMDHQISQVLAQGIADGDNPMLLARKLNKAISGIGADLSLTDTLGRHIPAERRAKLLARTEVIRAHHQGMMQEYKNFGMLGVRIQAEWQTAGDLRVCPECLDMEMAGPYTLEQVEGMIPLHPQCRCIALPLDVTGEPGAPVAVEEVVEEEFLDIPSPAYNLPKDITVQFAGKERTVSTEIGEVVFEPKTVMNPSGRVVLNHMMYMDEIGENTFFGNSVLEMSFKKKKGWHVTSIHVNDAYRGQGVGSTMIRMALSEVKEPIRTTGVFSKAGRTFFDRLVERGYAYSLEGGDDYLIHMGWLREGAIERMGLSGIIDAAPAAEAMAEAEAVAEALARLSTDFGDKFPAFSVEARAVRQAAGITDEALVAHLNAIGDELARLKDAFPGLWEMDGFAAHGGIGVKGKLGRFFNSYGIWNETGAMDIRLSMTAKRAAEKITLGEFSATTPTLNGTLRHELGHVAWDGALTEAQQDAWRVIFRVVDIEGGVGKYAAGQADEAFCEALMAYTHPEYARGMLPRKVERFLDDVLGVEARMVEALEPYKEAAHFEEVRERLLAEGGELRVRGVARPGVARGKNWVVEALGEDGEWGIVEGLPRFGTRKAAKEIIGRATAPEAAAGASAEVEKAFKNPKVSSSSAPSHAGVNESVFLTLEETDPYTGERLRGIFKAEEGERWGGIRDTVVNGNFTLANREELAYRIAVQLGMEDLLPETFMTEVGGRVGSMQRIIPNTRSVSGAVQNTVFAEDDAIRATLFDTLIGNTDRHLNNVLVNDADRLVLIDHGYSFPSKSRSYGFWGELRIGFLRSGMKYRTATGVEFRTGTTGAARMGDTWAARKVNDMVKALEKADIGDYVGMFNISPTEVEAFNERKKWLIDNLKSEGLAGTLDRIRRGVSTY